VDAVIRADNGHVRCGLCGKPLPCAAGIYVAGKHAPMCADCGRSHGAVTLADIVEDACALGRLGELLLVETPEHPAFNTLRLQVEFTAGENRATPNTLVALRAAIEEMGEEYYACGESLAAAVIDLHGQIIRARNHRGL